MLLESEKFLEQLGLRYKQRTQLWGVGDEVVLDGRVRQYVLKRRVRPARLFEFFLKRKN